MSSLASLKKIYLISRKSTDVGHFWLPRFIFNVSSVNVQAKFPTILVSFLGKVVRNSVVNFENSFSSGLMGGSRFASQHFPNCVISASCNFMGRPFVACYACFIVFFSVFANSRLPIAKKSSCILLAIRLLIREKLRLFSILGCFGRFLAISSLVLQNDWIYSIHFFKDPNRLKYFPCKTIPSLFWSMVSSE